MIFTQKKTIREALLVKRRKLSAEGIKDKSKHIYKNLLKSKKFLASSSFLIYISINNEVDTFLVIEYLKAHKRDIFVPAWSKGSWIISKFTNKEDLEPGPFGTKQPKGIKRGDTAKIDTILVPGVAFSRDGVRLGYGHGDYDKLLSGSSSYKIGLAYEMQLVAALPREDHDIVVDEIATEKQLYFTLR